MQAAWLHRIAMKGTQVQIEFAWVTIFVSQVLVHKVATKALTKLVNVIGTTA